MKNKHLVLLFLAVLALGLLARRLPWPLKQMLQTDLIAVDTAQVTQVAILHPDQSELLLERTEAGWAAAQDLRSVVVEAEKIEHILQALRSIRSLRIVKTRRPDTLGFSEKKHLQILVFRDSKIIEQFEIGDEHSENGQPATYIRLSRHEGIYLVENHLRGIFSKSLHYFRSPTVAQFDPQTVRAVMLEWPAQTPVFFEKNDSTRLWETPALAPVPHDSMLTWLSLFNRLNGSPFADHFDESRARKTWLQRTTLHLASSDSLVFRLFYVQPPELPEEITLAKKGLSTWVFHSSQNPSNFFAPTDTAQLRWMSHWLQPNQLR
ncbi:MAG: DUF4340 domain-containing protein [Saprospiraceae bacterium]|nr:DUF4340 domain-containing protein [Saprospiraceae bacterium]